MAMLLPGWTKSITLKHTGANEKVIYDERYITHIFPGFVDYYEVYSGEDVLLFRDYVISNETKRQEPFPYRIDRDLATTSSTAPQLTITYDPTKHIMTSPELGFNELIIRKDAGYIDLVEYYDATKVEYWIVNSFAPVEIIAGQQDFSLTDSGFLPLHIGREKNIVRQWSNILSDEDTNDLFLSKLLNLNMMLVKNDFNQAKAGMFEERLLKNIREEIFFIDRGMGEFEYIYPKDIFQLIRDRTDMVSNNFLPGSEYEKTITPNLKIISKKIRRNPFLFYKNYLMEYSLTKFREKINENEGDYKRIISHILQKMEKVQNRRERIEKVFKISSTEVLSADPFFAQNERISLLYDVKTAKLAQKQNITRFIPSVDDFICSLCHEKVIQIPKSDYEDMKSKRINLQKVIETVYYQKHGQPLPDPSPDPYPGPSENIICCSNCLITFDCFIISENVIPFLDEYIADEGGGGGGGGTNTETLMDALPLIEKQHLSLQAWKNEEGGYYIENKKTQLSEKLLTIISTIHLLKTESSPLFWKNINKYFLHPNKSDHLVTLFPNIKELIERLQKTGAYYKLSNEKILKKEVVSFMKEIFKP